MPLLILLFNGAEVIFQADPSTFPELVDEIAERLNLTSQDDLDRIGRQINRRYKRITTAVGLQTTRRRQLQMNVTEGVSTVVYSGAESIINVIDKSATKHKVLDKVNIEELRALGAYTASKPTKYAVVAQTASSVTIEINCAPQEVFTLYADVHSNIMDLSTNSVPLIPDSFHDTLLWGTLADEYLKLEKLNLNAKCESQYELRLSDLRMFVAKSAYDEVYQGKVTSATVSGGSGGSGSSANGASSYTQTGQIVFDRTGAADTSPFHVAAGSAKVEDFDADLLDGLDSTDFVLVSDLPTSLSAYTLLTTFNDHSVRHELGGADAIKLDDLSTPDDNTDLNASTTRHGLLKKISNVATEFLDGTHTFDTVKDSDLATTDITTNDVTTAKHGFVPKAPNDTAKFLRGDASWAAINPIDNRICDGRLTLTTAVPVTTSDVTGATSIFFTPYSGNRIALFDGSSTWSVFSFTERTIALGTLTNDLPYDVFVFDSSGTPTLEILAWTNKTTRATALVAQDGVLSKTGVLTRRYLGTFHTTATTTTEDSYAKRLLWNYYNRMPRSARKTIPTNSYPYTLDAFQQWEASTANQLAFVIGVAEVEVSLQATHIASNSVGSIAVSIAIGEDSTTTPIVDSLWGTSEAGAGIRESMYAAVRKLPAIGYHFYAGLERSAATGTTTWYGDNGGTRMQAGIIGTILG